jgi:hypothetical protein
LSNISRWNVWSLFIRIDETINGTISSHWSSVGHEMVGEKVCWTQCYVCLSFGYVEYGHLRQKVLSTNKALPPASRDTLWG